MAHGMSDYELQKQLIDCCYRLLPDEIPVVFHGDNEFGSVDLMKYLKDLGWDFIVGQSSKNCYRIYPNRDWQTFGALPVTKTRSIIWRRWRSHDNISMVWSMPLLLQATFWQETTQVRHYLLCHISANCSHSEACGTSVEVECQFQDMKSSGWNIQKSDVTHPKRREGLVTVLNLCYLWSTCLGRWLCKNISTPFSRCQTQPTLKFISYWLGLAC